MTTYTQLHIEEVDGRTVPVSLEFWVPGRPINIANARMGWKQRARVLKDRASLTQIMAQSAVAESMKLVAKDKRVIFAAVGKRSIAPVLRLNGHHFDPDNLIANLKADIDGMRWSGLLMGDTAELMELLPPHQTPVREPSLGEGIWWWVNFDDYIAREAKREQQRIERVAWQRIPWGPDGDSLPGVASG